MVRKIGNERGGTEYSFQDNRYFTYPGKRKCTYTG